MASEWDWLVCGANKRHTSWQCHRYLLLNSNQALVHKLTIIDGARREVKLTKQRITFKSLLARWNALFSESMSTLSVMAMTENNENCNKVCQQTRKCESVAKTKSRLMTVWVPLVWHWATHTAPHCVLVSNVLIARAMRKSGKGTKCDDSELHCVTTTHPIYASCHPKSNHTQSKQVAIGQLMWLIPSHQWFPD